MTEELYNVVMFFPDGSHHYERRNVPAKEAVECAVGCTRRPAVLLGIIRRVMITDQNDFTVFLWDLDKGLVFPTRAHVMFGENPPEGVKVIDMEDPAALHGTIGRAIGEDK